MVRAPEYCRREPSMPQIPVWCLPEVVTDGCVTWAEDNERGRATKPEDEADDYSMAQSERTPPEVELLSEPTFKGIEQKSAL